MNAGMNAPVKALASLLFAVAVASCGFQLRGQANLPFETLFVDGNSALLVELKRNIVAGTHTTLVPVPSGAGAVFNVDHEVKEKVILSLDTSGRVREYQLRYRVAYRVHDGKGKNWMAPDEIQLTRDISFNDQVLAKEAEESLLYRDMQTDMVQQIVRRLAAARVPQES
jgi:LPS-assembly lipoprotein